MKSLRLISLLLLPLLACKKENTEVSFRLQYQQEYSIPSSTGINLPFNLQSPPVASNSSQAFRNNNTSADRVSSISLLSMDFALSRPSGADFSFLESIAVTISAEGLAEDTLAFLNPVRGENLQSISLQASGRNFREYLSKEEFSLNLRAVTDEIITQDHDLEMNCEFRVTARLID